MALKYNPNLVVDKLTKQLADKLIRNAVSAAEETISGADFEVDSTYVEPSAKAGIFTPAANRLTAPATAQTFIPRGVKTGTVQLFAGANIPDGYLLCNGAAVSRTTFAELFAVVGVLYGAGDGVTTFNLPDMRNRYPIGAGENALGTYLEEQLPNVTGLATSGRWGVGAQSNVSALMTVSSGAPDCSYFACDGYGVHVQLDLNKGNSTYTNNGKVYPASLALNFIIRT